MPVFSPTSNACSILSCRLSMLCGPPRFGLVVHCLKHPQEIVQNLDSGEVLTVIRDQIVSEPAQYAESVKLRLRGIANQLCLDRAPIDIDLLFCLVFIGRIPSLAIRFHDAIAGLSQ